MTRGAAREGRVRAALAAYALIKKRRETRAAWATFQLRLHLERLFIRNEVVLGVIACIAMADNERRTVERASAVEGGSDEEGSSDNNRRGRGASQGVQCPNSLQRIRTKCHMHACHVTPIHTVSRATRTPCTLPLPPAAASVVAVANLPPAAAALSLALAASLAASLAAPAAVALRAATVAFGATPLSIG